jgi:hypothetical protein
MPPLQGGRLQIGMAEIKSDSVADFTPESVADFPRNTQGQKRSVATILDDVLAWLHLHRGELQAVLG